MKKVIVSFFLLISLVGCSSSHDKKLVGEWRGDFLGLTGYNFYKDGTFDIYVWGDLEGKDVCKWSTKGNTIKMKCDGIDEYSGEYTYSLENDNQHLTIINNDIEYGYDKE